MHMISWLAKHIIKFFSNLLHNIALLIVVGIISLPVLISWATGTLDFLLQIIQTPVPIWGIILLVLLVFVYLKIRRNYPSSKLGYKTKYFTIGNFKWETKIYNYGGFDVENTPLCAKHDLRLLFSGSSRYCPEVDKRNCKNQISGYDHYKIYSTAQSYIEKQIKNKC